MMQVCVMTRFQANADPGPGCGRSGAGRDTGRTRACQRQDGFGGADVRSAAPELPFALVPAASTTMSDAASGPAPVCSAPEAALPRAVPPPPLPVAPPAGEASSSSRDHCHGGGSDAAASCQVFARQSATAAVRLAALRGLVRPGDLCGGDALSARGDAASAAAGARWRLGDDAVDGMLGPGGLAIDGLHEVKPACGEGGGCHAGDRAAALAFVLRLARLRLMALEGAGHGGAAAPVLLWCQPRHIGAELGQLHAPGLPWIGIDPEQVILVETARREDTLWAMEEGLASSALALVAGFVEDVGLTPARRLALRAERSRTPCLLLTSPRSAPTAATATRWRIARHRSALHPFDPRAPGALRLGVSLERCRQQPLMAEAAAFTLEWSDEAYCFHMASGMADRTDGARAAGRRAA